MKARLVVFTVFLGLLLAGCAAPQSLPGGPTPIPTLIPATLPVTLPGEPTEAPIDIQSYPARKPSVELATAIYGPQCAGCHGEDGRGTVPGARNFQDLDFMRGESPTSFYAAITEGRGQMPAFQGRMTSDERWDTVAKVWSFSTTPESLALGQSIYETNCVACHGEDGTGKVLGAADFSDLRIMGSRAPRDFYLVLTQGRGSMPAWQGRLSQDERWSVIDYLRTFTFDSAIGEEAGPEGQPTAEATAGVEAACDAATLAKTNPFTWDDQAAIEAGDAIYGQSCSACHAPDGSGAITGAPDFTSQAYQAQLRREPGEALCVMTLGRGAMPGWREVLTEDQIWQVLTFLGSLGS
ncbi:MAG TPA: c-type cytochrome [Anaerolineales bacterium]|nr:c-type cytochrome [Anaerolineales bacterium]